MTWQEKYNAAVQRGNEADLRTCTLRGASAVYAAGQGWTHPARINARAAATFYNRARYRAWNNTEG